MRSPKPQPAHRSRWSAQCPTSKSSERWRFCQSSWGQRGRGWVLPALTGPRWRTGSGWGRRGKKWSGRCCVCPRSCWSRCSGGRTARCSSGRCRSGTPSWAPSSRTQNTTSSAASTCTPTTTSTPSCQAVLAPWGEWSRAQSWCRAPLPPHR